MSWTSCYITRWVIKTIPVEMVTARWLSMQKIVFFILWIVLPVSMVVHWSIKLSLKICTFSAKSVTDSPFTRRGRFSMTFQRICNNLVSKINLRSKERAYLTMEPFHCIYTFEYLVKGRTICLGNPVLGAIPKMLIPCWGILAVLINFILG